MTSNRNAPLPARAAESDPCDEMRQPASGFVAGGPVGAIHAELNARLNAAEYEHWLLPPQPREGKESIIHAVSVTAGGFAMICGLWIISLFV